ncbi:MAG: Gldg family protein [Odoribacteraceae bacterium]|jgi:ABC-2 type transport system permease protein|nr:Gldg family protein [Odoribacteraceae bacterium]
MRKILKIATRELNTLFYSPVAWLILIIFVFQASMVFTNVLNIIAQQQFVRPLWYSVANGIFTGTTGTFLPMHGHLYLYIPLLTMGLMSRELSSGTIKLLYSSPVTTFQIVAGKFLSMMIYGLLLVSVFLLMMLFLAWRTPHLDAGVVWSGIAGTYLLIITYAAIGLFVSSLTSYQIVAAVGTLAVLAFLNHVSSMWQGVDFLRDITYWLSPRGRAETMVSGLARGEDVCYFLLVIALFITLAAIKVASGKHPVSHLASIARYGSVTVVVLLAGYVTSLPRLGTFFDATAIKGNTLAPESQEIMRRLTGGLTITTYVNLLDNNLYEGLPANRNVDIRRFARHTRFKPETRMNYVYYYADPVNPGEKRKDPAGTLERARERAYRLELDLDRFLPLDKLPPGVDLAPEGYHFTRLLQRESGEQSFLRIFADGERFPREQEITTALKRLVIPAPHVAFLTGHGERDARRAGDKDYYTFANSRSFRHSLVNSGFDIISVTCDDLRREEIDILVIADPRAPLSPGDRQSVERYVESGGNLVLLADPAARDNVAPLAAAWGVQLLPGTLVQPSRDFDDDFLACRVTAGAAALNSTFRGIARQNYLTIMPGALAMTHDTLHGFRVTPVLQSRDSTCWNEFQTTDFVNEKATLDDDERQGTYTTMLALLRTVGDREQRIVIAGDADCTSNAELLMQRPGLRAANFTLITGMFRWLTRNEFPLVTTHPTPKDTLLRLDREDVSHVKIAFMICLPLLLALRGAWCLARRKKR